MKSHISLAGLALLATGQALAQNPTEPENPTVARRLDTVTVTSLRPVAIDKTTSAVSVIDSDLLSLRDTGFLADQLRASPGLGVSQSGVEGALTQVRLRGAEANHTLLLIDGVEVSDPVTGEVDFGLWSGLPVRRVEIARGEQSALHGSDAIGGVIAVTAGAEGLLASVEGGSRGAFALRAGYGETYDAGSAGVYLSSQRTDGVDISGLGGEKDGSSSQSALFRGGLDIGGGWSLTGLARVAEATAQSDPSKDFSAADYLTGGPLSDADRETASQIATSGVGLSGEAFGVDHLIRASFGRTVRKNTAEDELAGKSKGDRLKLSYSPSFVFGDAVRQTLTALADYEDERYRQDNFVNAADPFSFAAVQKAELSVLGLAAEYRLSVGGFDANVSVRHDDNDGSFDDSDTWRVGAAYGFGFGGRLRGSVGEGVKNPTFTELFGYYPGVFGFVGNAALKPERSRSFEIGWDQIVGDAILSATWFSADLEDEIYTAFDANFNATPMNRDGASEREGVEGAVDWAVTDTIRLNAMATHTQSQNDSGDDELRVPDWTGALSVDWRPQRLEGASLGIALDYVGKQHDRDFRPDASFGTRPVQTLDDYVLVSARAAWPVHERIQLTLRGENLLDEDAIDVIGFHKPGAGIFFGVTVR